MKPWLKRGLPYAAVVLATATATLFVVRARAAGIPDTDVLTYTGYLEDGDGAPLTGTHSIAVRFWEADAGGADLCTAELDTVTLQSGRFQVSLPQTCVDAVKASANLFADVVVDGASLGRTRIGAVPYAIEAGRAAVSDVATAANEAAGDLDARIVSIEDTIDTLAQASLPIVTGWQQYTPTLTRDGGGAVANASSLGAYRRVGDSLEVSVVSTFSAAPASGATWYQWSLPPGHTIDYARLPGGNALGIVGSGFTNKGTANGAAMSIWVRSTGSVSASANGGSIYYVNDTVPFAVGSDTSFQMMFTVPIAGWTTTTP